MKFEMKDAGLQVKALFELGQRPEQLSAGCISSTAAACATVLHTEA